jgi:hypothetical protein
MITAALAGDLATARTINFRLLSLHRHLFVEANPIPVKWACVEMGLIENGLRLPMTPLSPEHHERVRSALREAGIQFRFLRGTHEAQGIVDSRARAGIVCRLWFVAGVEERRIQISGQTAAAGYSARPHPAKPR